MLMRKMLAGLAVACSMVLVPGVQAQCSGDVNGDGRVDGIDLATVLGQWGPCPATITSVSPSQGSVLGGTVITITGTGLAGTTGVTVGGNPCSGVTVLSPTQVRATTPAGAAGQAAVAVTTPAGTTLATTPFSYFLQAVTSIEPASGVYLGGTAITISGTYLAGTTSVTIGGVPCTNVVAVNSTTVTAVTPPGLIGSFDVVVTGAKVSVTVPGGFTFFDLITPPWATLIEAVPDPAVVTNATLRNAVLATGYAWRVKDTATQIEMLLVPPGTFDMGCIQPPNGQQCAARELPVHVVTLTDPFYLGRYEVTAGEYAGQTNGSRVAASLMSWNAAFDFMQARGMRFPTESEWEYACRAGTQTAYHSGPGFPAGTSDPALASGIAWFGTFTSPREVGLKAANALGFHDMIGNVWENVSDFYGNYPADAQVDPIGPISGEFKVHRGGSFGDSLNDSRGYVRSTGRSWYGPEAIGNNVGFRVARNP
jgi:formylglycine-generating enzyme required for sulfatase activity